MHLGRGALALTLGAMLLSACTITLNGDDDEPTAPSRLDETPAEGGAGGMTSSGTDRPNPIAGGCTTSAKDGTCSGTQVVYCEDDQLERLDCATVGEGCAEKKGRADCAPIERLTACGELDAHGECQGNNITWCDETRIMAVPVEYDCGVYGQQCDPTAAADGGAVCLSHGECGAIDEDGACDGNTLSYCDGGELYVFDCESDQCREVGGLADCFTAGSLSDCGSETNAGRCDGQEVVRCLGGTVSREDCELIGMECSASGTAHCQRPSSCFANCASGYTCEDGVCTGPSDVEREWTIAMYMVGDNNLSNIVWQDLNEMEAIDLGEDVQIVAEMEMSAEYTSFGDERFRQGAYRFAVQADTNASEVTSLEDAEELGEVDMTDPDHLAEYLRWAAETYPSKKFAVVFWDHGFGWRGGFVDSRSSGLLSLEELVAGIRDSGTNPELVGFDACLMGMHEVALALRGVSDTMVASEESVPGGGYPYDKVLERLLATPTMNAQALGEVIADEYTTHFDEGLRARSVTMSVVDLSQASTVNEQLATFSQAFLEDLPGRRSEVRSAIRSGDLLRFREKDSADLVSTLEVFGALGGGLGTAADDFPPGSRCPPRWFIQKPHATSLLLPASRFICRRMRSVSTTAIAWRIIARAPGFSRWSLGTKSSPTSLKRTMQVPPLESVVSRLMSPGVTNPTARIRTLTWILSLSSRVASRPRLPVAA